MGAVTNNGGGIPILTSGSIATRAPRCQTGRRGGPGRDRPGSRRDAEPGAPRRAASWSRSGSRTPAPIPTPASILPYRHALVVNATTSSRWSRAVRTERPFRSRSGRSVTARSCPRRARVARRHDHADRRALRRASRARRRTADHRQRHVRPAAVLRRQALAPSRREWSSARISSSSTSFRSRSSAYYARPAAGAAPDADVVQLRVLRLGEPAVLFLLLLGSTLARLHRRGWSSQSLKACWSAASTSSTRSTALQARQADPDDLGGTNLSLLGFFKYFNFGVDSYDALVDWLGLAAASARHRPAGDAAARHQLLHVPVDELRHRRLPRRRARDQELHRLRLLRVDVPAAGRRADHPLLRDRGSAAFADPHRDEVRARRRVLLRSAWRRRSCSPTPAARSPTSRSTRARLSTARRLVRRHRLRLPDLLRFQRLLGHGDRPRPDARLRVRQELRLALPVAVDHRVLAPLAHLALDLAARLPLRAARRQPQRASSHLRQPLHRHAARRPVARRRVELS